MKSNIRIASVFLVAAVFFSGAAFGQNERSYIAPGHASNPDASPLSGAVLVGNTLYLSGSLGLNRGQVPETAEEEATNVLNRIKQRLEQAGMTMDDLVYVQVFCSNVEHYGAFNSVYKTFFTQEYPARAFIGSGDLLAGARFEVQGIAVKRDD